MVTRQCKQFIDDQYYLAIWQDPEQIDNYSFMSFDIDALFSFLLSDKYSNKTINNHGHHESI